MGKYDEETYCYLSVKEYFADLINAGCFDGREVVAAKDLEQVSGRAQERDCDGKAKSTYRDLRMKMKNGPSFVMLAVENQSETDWEMPFRILRYDAAEYGKQIEEIHGRKRKQRKESGLLKSHRAEKMNEADKLRPVYTVCFYHGPGEWNGPEALSDVMEFGEEAEEWKAQFSDYPIKVINAEDGKVAKRCRTQLRQFLQVMGARRDRKRLKELLCGKDYVNLSLETARIIAVMANLPRFLEHEEEYENEKGGYNVCQAMEELKEELREEGLAEGRAETLLISVRNLMDTMKWPLEQTMNALKIPEGSRDKIRATLK